MLRFHSFGKLRVAAAIAVIGLAAASGLIVATAPPAAASSSDCWVPGSVGHVLAHQSFPDASIVTAALAEANSGTTCATGSSQPGECVMAVMRWVAKAGGKWDNTGRPDTLYSASGAIAVTNPAQNALPGDIVQYVSNASPGAWVTGVHTYIIVSNHHDGTYEIAQSNVPTGSGHVTHVMSQRISPPTGFRADVWRMGSTAYAYSVTAQQAFGPDGATATDLSRAWLGETGFLRVTVQNTGTSTWDTHVALATAQPNGRLSALYASGWYSASRVAYISSPVVSGSSYTFTFPFAVQLSNTSSVVEHFNLVDEGVTWFPDTGLNYAVTLTKTVDRAIALRHHGTGGYSVAPDGTVSAFGGAPALADMGTTAWPGWDIARGIALRPDDQGGYVLDGWGGLHPFGNAPAVNDNAYWKGTDIARAVALRNDGRGGYVLDGWGGVHGFAGAPVLTGTAARWPTWDIARAFVLRSDDAGGYLLDGWGGLHAFGSAPALTGGSYWQGWDIARAVALRSDGQGGWVLDGWGGLHAFGSAPAVDSGVYWSGWDVAKAFAENASNGFVLDGAGVAHTVAAFSGCQNCS